VDKINNLGQADGSKYYFSPVPRGGFKKALRGDRQSWITKQKPERGVGIFDAVNRLNVLGEIPEHLAAVFVDIFSGRSWAILCPHAVSGFKTPTGILWVCPGG
jgi:hypothetical protein